MCYLNKPVLWVSVPVNMGIQWMDTIVRRHPYNWNSQLKIREYWLIGTVSMYLLLPRFYILIYRYRKPFRLIELHSVMKHAINAYNRGLCRSFLYKFSWLNSSTPVWMLRSGTGMTPHFHTHCISPARVTGTRPREWSQWWNRDTCVCACVRVCVPEIKHGQKQSASRERALSKGKPFFWIT